MQRPIFRQAALEQLAAPEELDQLMQITTPRSWLALLALIGVIVAVVVWGFTDTLPTDGVGRGMLMRGGRVFSIAATTAGTVEQISVQVGDNVQKGQVIATIRPQVTKTITLEDQHPINLVLPKR